MGIQHEQKENLVRYLGSIRIRMICALMGASVAGFSDDAVAHQAPTGWSYPWSCCSNLDCREIGIDAISEPSESDPDYVIRPIGERLAPDDRRVRQSPNGAFRWCAHQAGVDAGHTICLFVPARGF